MSQDPWGIWKNGTFYDFPAPLKSYRISDSYDMDTQKAVLVDGEQLSGVSQNGVKVDIAGCTQIQNHDDPVCTARNQIAAWAAFRSAIKVSGEDKFELFLHYSPIVGNTFYRKFKRCAPTEVVVSFGDDNRTEYPYSASFHCEDPVIYTTAGGA